MNAARNSVALPLVARNVFARIMLPLILGTDAVHAGETTPAGSLDYAVLTPAFDGNYGVHSVSLINDLATGGLNRARTRELRDLVGRERYSAADNLASRVVEAMNEAGYSADIEEVRRGPEGSRSRLSRADLPPHPKGRHLVAISIDSIGLASSVTKWEPTLQLQWWVLQPNGDVISLPHRYIHGPASNEKNGGEHRTRNCELSTFSRAMDDPATVWRCFDLAFREAGVNLAKAIPSALHDARDRQ